MHPATWTGGSQAAVMQHAMLTRATTEALTWLTMKTRTCSMGRCLATVPWTDQVGRATYLSEHAMRIQSSIRTNLPNVRAASIGPLHLVFLHRESQKSLLQGQKTCSHDALPSVNSIATRWVTIAETPSAECRSLLSLSHLLTTHPLTHLLTHPLAHSAEQSVGGNTAVFLVQSVLRLTYQWH